MSTAVKNMIVLAVIFVSMVEAVPYSKYGRTCQDIGCQRNEVCEIAKDKNGFYPTCKKTNPKEESCTTVICPSGQFCEFYTGKPVCVDKFAKNDHHSTGVSPPKGQKRKGHLDDKTLESIVNAFDNLPK